MYQMRDLGMVRQQIPRPAQRMRRGLGTGTNERDDLISELPLAHAGPGRVVARGQQQREHISHLLLCVLSSLTTCRNDLLHEGIVDGHGASKTPVARCRYPERRSPQTGGPRIDKLQER